MKKIRIKKRRSVQVNGRQRGKAQRLRDWFERRRVVRTVASHKWSVLLIAAAVLLGRATILETLMPFGIAYYAVIYYLRRDLHPWVAIAVFAGSWLSNAPLFWLTGLQLLLLFMIFRGMESYGKGDPSFTPIPVFTSMLVIRLFEVLAYGSLSWYSFTMVVVEAGLGFVLTLVFMQAIPVFMMVKKPVLLRHEEIICLMILLGSVLTGAVGWIVQGMAVEHVLSRYALLLFALAGGAPLGAAVGVVTGLILSLADFGAIMQIGMLAFAGMLAGLLREGGKLAAAFGLLIGTSILTMYTAGQGEVIVSLWEAGCATMLLIMTPRRWLQSISRFVPGTNEHAKLQYDYARRVRETTADRVQQYSEVFRQLSGSFEGVAHNRQIVADQLRGVSQVMEDLAVEIKREGQTLHLQEEQIREAVEGLGLSVQGVDIVNLEEGNVEIELYHSFGSGYDECRKIIAPLLSDILGEHIAVKAELPPVRSGEATLVCFGSARQYDVETGVAGVAKGGDFLSGDSHSIVEIGGGKLAVAISDGMGGGERARQESSAALSILQQLLKSGMDEKLAIKSVNSVLLLRSPDEIFATIDFAIIDLYSAKTTFMKIGSTPSFIKRGNEVLSVAANNLPVGILNDIEVDFVGMQLFPGDMLIMMSDGVYDAPGYAVNKDLWMKRMIRELRTDNPQEVADVLLDGVVRYQEGRIADDMTVVVAKIEKYMPEWSSFRWPYLSHLERPRTVS